MKKLTGIIALLLTLILALGMTACKNDKDTEKETTPAEPQTTTENADTSDTLVGLWSFDASNVSKEKIIEVIVDDSGFNDIAENEYVAEKLAVSSRIDDFRKMFEVFCFEFNADGTCTYRINANAYTEALTAFSDTICEILEEADSATLAEILSCTEDEVKSALESGEFNEFINTFKETTKELIDSDLAGWGTINADGFIYTDDSGTYTYDGKQLIMGTVTLDITRNGDFIHINSYSEAAEMGQYFDMGVGLKKIK